ncbi:MAG: PPOX class F420-dependent oxidoreductase [Chloroflexota bacterium]
MKHIEQFKNQQYINLETYRKNGVGVKTPVWFAQDGDTLRVWTSNGSGKVKRIRRDGSVRIAPSTATGEPTGEWTSANVVILESDEDLKHTNELFYKKYGWLFNMFAALGKIRGGSFITLKVQFN